MPNATGLRRQRNINYAGPSGVHDYDVYILVYGLVEWSIPKRAFKGQCMQ